MIVMIEASTHTIARLWERARSLSKGDPEDREFGAGMQEVLRGLGVTEPAPATSSGCGCGLACQDLGAAGGCRYSAEYPEPFGNETRGSPP